MTVGHVLALLAGFVIGAFATWRAMRQQEHTVLMRLDPGTIDAIVRAAVAQARDEMEDEPDDEEEFWRANGDGWKL